jgi:uncharacterized protein (DUF111 family)
MVLGALLDAGLPLDELRRALGSLAIEGASVSATRVLRAGVSATKFIVEEHGTHDHGHEHTHHSHDHAHDHQHPHSDGHSHGPEHSHAAAAVAHQHHHDHRSLAEINRLIERSALSPPSQIRAQELFHRLGEAEAAIHQIPIDKIHLHEVGALDSIIDIVGAVFAMEWFHADQVISSALNVGGGMVNSAHGHFPVPAPATVKLLGNAPVYSSGIQSELVTPTGALLVTSYATSYGPVPSMTIEHVGYGAGDRDMPNTPNVLRVLVGESTSQPQTERIVVLECEIDDMNPQIFGLVMDRLYAAGALEVFFASVQMKKNRPGHAAHHSRASRTARGPDVDCLPRDDDHRRAVSRGHARAPRARDCCGRHAAWNGAVQDRSSGRCGRQRRTRVRRLPANRVRARNAGERRSSGRRQGIPRPIKGSDPLA